MSLVGLGAVQVLVANLAVVLHFLSLLGAAIVGRNVRFGRKVASCLLGRGSEAPPLFRFLL